MKFLMKKIMLEKKKKKHKDKKTKKLRKLMLSSSTSTTTQNHLVNVVKEGAKKKRLQSNAFLPDELIAEIISVLSIKTIVQFKCVSKSWNILISDPSFAEKHLSKSSQNPRLILTPTWKYHMNSVVSYPVLRLLENRSCTVSGDHNCHGWADTVKVVGTCKGLLCLLLGVRRKHRFRLWNPATRTISEELGTFHGNKTFNFSFGCDISTGTYKVVAYGIERDEEKEGSLRSQLRLFDISDNCWRDIASFPLIPITCIEIKRNNNGERCIFEKNNGAHLSGTVNWLALCNYHNYFYGYKEITSVEQFVIVSLDLSTETYTQFLLPSGFDQVPRIQPTLEILLDCLCFSHDFKRIEFVIWQMKEFGVQESWTQIFRIDYFNLQINTIAHVISNMGFIPDDDMELLEDIYDCKTPLLPLYLSKNGDTLILAYYENDRDRAIIYNGRDKSVERIRIHDELCWYSSMNYVESLVSPPWKTRSTSSLHSTYSMQDSQIAMIVGDK